MFTIDKKTKQNNKSFYQYFAEKEYRRTGIDESFSAKKFNGLDPNEDYFSNGFWLGAGAEQLGFGELPIIKGELEKHGNSLHPKTGEKIAKKAKPDVKKYLGTCLSYVKDPSILYFTDEELGQEAYEADYQKSLKATIAYVNKHCFFRKDKSNKLHKGNIICAVIPHETSRPTEDDNELDVRPDMQIHAHLLISRLAVDPNTGECYALYNRDIFKFQKAIGAKFRAEQAKRLRERGFSIDKHVDYQEKEDGKKVKVFAFSVKGITQEQRDLFSKRKQAIDYLAQRYGITSTQGRNKLAQGFKKTKKIYDRDELIHIWKDDAASVGLTNESIQELKTFDNNYILNHLKTDESLFLSVVRNSGNKKTGDINIHELMAKLFEYEQYTGIDAENTFDRWVKEGKLTVLDKYNAKCNIDLTLRDKKEKTLKVKKAANISKVRDVVQSGKYSVNDLIDNKISQEQFTAINPNAIKVPKGDCKKKDHTSSQNDSPLISSVASTIEGLGIQIGLLQGKLRNQKLSEFRKISVRLQIEALQRQIEALRVQQLNQDKKYLPKI